MKQDYNGKTTERDHYELLLKEPLLTIISCKCQSNTTQQERLPEFFKLKVSVNSNLNKKFSKSFFLHIYFKIFLNSTFRENFGSDIGMLT